MSRQRFEGGRESAESVTAAVLTKAASNVLSQNPGESRDSLWRNLTKRILCKLTLIAVLATNLAHAQRPDVGSQTRAQQQRPVTPGQTDNSQEQSSVAPGAPSSAANAEKPDPAELQIQIQRAFQQDPALAADNLGAYVSTDKVSLAGTVATHADKDRAQAIAQSMADGRAVVNDIRVSEMPDYIHRADPSATGATSPPGTSTSPSDTTNRSNNNPPRH